MSGLEVPGLILGALPLALHTLKFCITTIDDLQNYKSVFKRFKLDLDMELCILQQVCLTIFADTTILQDATVSPDNAQIEKLREILEEKLRPEVAQPFADGVAALLESVKELEKILEPVKEGPKKSKRQLVKRIYTLLVLKEPCHEQLAIIRNINTNLYRLVSMGGILQASKTTDSKISKRQLDIVTQFSKRVRSHSMILYELLKEKFQAPNCDCKETHTVGLELEKREICSASKGPSATQGDAGAMKFKFLFSFKAPKVYFPSRRCWELELDCFEGEEFSTSRLSYSNRSIDIPATVPLNITVNEGTEATLPSVQADCSPNSCGSDSLPPPSPVPQSAGLSRPSTPTPSPKSPKRKKRTRFAIAEIIPFGRSPSPDLSSSAHPYRSEGTIVARPLTPASLSSSSLPLESSSVTPVGRELNLCSILKGGNCATQASWVCLGTILGEGGRKCSIWPPSAPSPAYLFEAYPAATVSLETLISTRHKINQKQRLALGLKLASSVIQLHNTEWLHERWGKEDIIFLVSNNSQHGNVPFFDKPMIRRFFSNGPCLPQATCQPPRSSHIYGCNRTLFSLGIILLELWYWCSLEGLSAATNRLEDNQNAANATNAQQQHLMDSDMRAYVIAKAQLEDLRENALELYSQAVAVCISGLPHIYARDLGDDELKREVWKLIVCPLRQTLEFWSQRP